MKREYHNKFKYNDVLICNMTLETNVLVAIFLAGVAKTVIFIVVINYFLGRKDNLKNTTVESKN